MTIPIYDPNTPQFLIDSFAVTGPQFLANFTTLATAFARNHIPLTSATNIGNHTLINLIEQLNPIQTDVSNINIYVKNATTVPGQDVATQTDQVFFRYQGNGQEFQFTNYQIYALPSVANRVSFFTILPGRIMVYFGEFNKLPSNVLHLSPPIATNIMSISFCPTGKAIAGAQQYKPWVTILPKNPQGFIDRIGVLASIGAAPPSFYLILANI